MSTILDNTILLSLQRLAEGTSSVCTTVKWIEENQLLFLVDENHWFSFIIFLVLTIAGLLKVKLKLWNSEDENIKCKNSPLDNIFLFELIKIVLEGSLGFVEVILVKVGVVLKVVLEWLNSDERLEQSVRCNSTFQLQQRSVLTQICNKSYWDRTISPILYNWTIQWNLTQCRQPRLCGGLIYKSYNEGTVFSWIRGNSCLKEATDS